GSVLRWADSRTLIVSRHWSVPYDRIAGFAFRSLVRPEDAVYVDAYTERDGVLHLSGPVGAEVVDHPFELISPEEAPVLAARMITGTGLGDPLPPVRMRLATTRGTNALLEKTGSRVAFFVTRGFADLLRIGTQ